MKVLFKNSGYPRLILMNKLMILEKYNIVVDLFEAFYMKGEFNPNLAESTNSSSKFALNPNKFLFPHDQFSLVTSALLRMVDNFW